MRKSFSVLIFIGTLILITLSCKTKWTNAIDYGNVIYDNTRATVDIEINKKLIIVPITIQGKEYRFLFDTGAPLSISNKLQEELNFRIVSKGNIIDSDRNRKKVRWVEVESINIGDISFQKQTAFIGDFEANPVLRCLRIDGILGSNLIRHCNWTMDQEQKSLTLFKNMEEFGCGDCVEIPFKTDYQYNMFVDLHIGEVTVKNVLVDYGSNGAISLNDEIFRILKDKNIIDEIGIEEGFQQSGIVGKTVGLSRETAYSDSVSINGINLKKVLLSTGKTVSIGNKFLSRFRTTIDWDNGVLYLSKNEKNDDSVRFSGFKLGYSVDLGVYIQSVVRHSSAYDKGVRPLMKVVKLDGLNFEGNHNFCDCLNHEYSNSIYMELVDSYGYRMEYHHKQINENK